jgi:hypothetical protein
MEGTLIESPDSPNVFWHYMDVVKVQFETCVDRGVEVYWELGLVSVLGKLFKINRKLMTPKYYTHHEMKMNIRFAQGFSIRRLTPSTFFRLSFDDSDMRIDVGEYVLFFTSLWNTSIQINSYYLRLYKWMPGLRTCDQLLVRLQRAWRRRQSARRALALGMAFHDRLGKSAEVACLGADLYRLICGGL